MVRRRMPYTTLARRVSVHQTPVGSVESSRVSPPPHAPECLGAEPHGGDGLICSGGQSSPLCSALLESVSPQQMFQ